MNDTFTKKEKKIYMTMLSLSAVFIGLFFFSIIERPKYMKVAVYLLPIWFIFGYWIYKNIPLKVSVRIIFILDANCSPFPKDRARPVCMFISSIERYLLIFNPIYFVPCLFYASIIGLLLFFNKASTKVNHSNYMLLFIIVTMIFPTIFNIKF